MGSWKKHALQQASADAPSAVLSTLKSEFSVLKLAGSEASPNGKVGVSEGKGVAHG